MRAADAPPVDLSGWLVAVCGLATLLGGAVIWLWARGRNSGSTAQKATDEIKALHDKVGGLEGQLGSVLAHAEESARTIERLEHAAVKSNDCKLCRKDVDGQLTRLNERVAALSESNARAEERVKTLFESLNRVESALKALDVKVDTKIGALDVKMDLILQRLAGALAKQRTGEGLE